MIDQIFLGLAALYAGLMATRGLLAARQITRSSQQVVKPVDMAEVTILQPILGGDPALAACLEQNLRNAPQARFIWLLDELDHQGRTAAAQAILATGRHDIIQSVGAEPPMGINPKVHKLCRGADLVTTPYLATLDDDTVLPPGAIGTAAALAEPGRLVTGLPSYESRSTVWSRLVTGFVNGNAVVTYPPAALLGVSRTINGMFALMRRDDLANRGGFNAILGEVTDDYALAKLFLNQGGSIVQTCLCHPIVTTIHSPAHYVRLMRRWMVFANIYVRENASPAMLAIIVLPSMLPLPLLLAGIAAGPAQAAMALGLLAAKAWIVRLLAARLRAAPTPVSDMAYEMAADLLNPVHALAAALRPNRIRWRNRDMVLSGSRIVSE